MKNMILLSLLIVPAVNAMECQLLSESIKKECTVKDEKKFIEYINGGVPERLQMEDFDEDCFKYVVENAPLSLLEDMNKALSQNGISYTELFTHPYFKDDQYRRVTFACKLPMIVKINLLEHKNQWFVRRVKNKLKKQSADYERGKYSYESNSGSEYDCEFPQLSKGIVYSHAKDSPNIVTLTLNFFDTQKLKFLIEREYKQNRQKKNK